MGNLILTRHQGDSIRLTIDPAVDPQEALRWILEEGIDITVAEVQGERVRLAIRAPDELRVVRGELVVEGEQT